MVSLIFFISIWKFVHCSFALPFISFYCDDFELSSSVSLTVKMDETRIDNRIDDTYQEDEVTDDIALLPAQHTRLRTLHSLSVFSDDSVCVGYVPSSPTRSTLHLASMSSESFGSPYTDGNPNTASTGLGISSVSSSSLHDSVRDELLREFFADMRSDLLRSKQETAVVQQENTALRQRIEPRRTGISFCARPWLAHIHSCFALSICARPRLAHIDSCFDREYALGSTSRIPCFSLD